MRIAVFGGSFNPPHKGHVLAAPEAMRQLGADRLLVIPAGCAPHKTECAGSPAPEERLELTRLAFEGLPGICVTDMEISRGGKSFTVDTLRELHRDYPRDELVLLMGADMLMCLDTKWRSFEEILKLAVIGAFSRAPGEEAELQEKCAELKSAYGARIELVSFVPFDISSTRLRELLPKRQGAQYLPEAVYAEIIRKRYYGARPEAEWLRARMQLFMDERRLKHSLGVEAEARRLAERWGADPDLASEAGILHDITKKQKAEEQLKLCEKYDIITDDDERASYKLLHAKTGAAMARELFGISDAVYSAILWHTTGKADMSLLEKIIYIADYIEPNRDFEGLTELRQLAYENLDEALLRGLEMTFEDLCRNGKKPHANSVAALEYLRARLGKQ